MIAQIIELLQTLPFYGVSEEVEIAKGKYEYTLSIKKNINKIKKTN